jgi:signal transduction histidine kinase/ligand-binding sensor domain-containing protein
MPVPPCIVAQNCANSKVAGDQIRVCLREFLAFASGFRMAFGSAAMIFGIASTGFALEPSTPLASYNRQAWVMENGLPQNTVQALLQTRDGFVWLGTEVGLVRFDGIGFQLYDRNTTPSLPSNDVRCLLETPDGALWIGTSDGLARWKDGAVMVFTTKDGLPGNRIEHLDPDGRGGILVNRAATFQNGRWVHVVFEFAALQDGARAEFQAHLVGELTAVASKNLIELWRGHNQVERLSVGKDLPGSRIQSLFADREGSLWIGTNSGLARLFEGKVQRLPATDPLAKTSILALTEDREGNLWVGTEADGLLILRDQRFRTIGAREGLSSDATTTVVEGASGKLWVGTSGGGLNALPRGPSIAGAASIYPVRDVLLSNVILSLAAAPNGDLWVGTPDGLNRIRGSAVYAFTSADGLPDDFIRSLLLDRDGSLWIGTRRGLTHWIEPGGSVVPGGGVRGIRALGKMETFTQANGLGSDLVGAMTRDSKGDLWVATFAGLSRLHGGKIANYSITNYTVANGLSSNVITALLARKNGTLLIGTQDHGWNLWDGMRFTAAGVGKGGLGESAIHAILDDGSNHLWFSTENGLARGECPETPIDSIDAEPGGCLSWMEFGTADGLRSRETATNSHPSAWRSHDGHLWFATPKGLVEVDPAHFPVNIVPPPVALEQFAIDDVSQPLHAAGSVVQIQAGHVHFEFDYAGLSFVAPQKVRYRYTLEGIDHGWTDAGTRRTAYYTNIPSGSYTFRVQAANDDGVWNTAGAALTFELRPHFYQTLWFYALLIVALVGLVILIQRMRLKRAEREFNAVLGERNRIAREIHDTLAQGYVGISVQLEVLAELLRLRKVEAAASHLDLTRGYVREGLADARQSIWALRSQDSGETTLPVKLRRMVETEGNHGLESTCSIFGAYRPLPPGTEQEILRVAQEAIQNVKKHAEARKLLVQLDYGPQEITLEVRDDGQGFIPDEAPAPGHFGLTGMRERAAVIGGMLKVTSEPGAGTTVRLRVAAYRERQVSMKEQQ